MSLSIDLLSSKKHDRSTFQCGDDSLDDYIKTKASQELKKKVSTPFVLTEPPNQAVRFYIRHGFIEFSNNPLKLYISMKSIKHLNL